MNGYINLGFLSRHRLRSRLTKKVTMSILKKELDPLVKPEDDGFVLGMRAMKRINLCNRLIEIAENRH